MTKNIEKPLIFFLGAGASKDSGLPLGDNAARYIVKSLFKRIELNTLYKSIESYESDKQINLWPRFEVVVKFFEDYINNSAKSIVKSFFNCGISSTCLTLAKLKRKKIWLTTNFDNQIELALEKENVKYEVITDRQKLANLIIDSIKCDLIIKLHGDATEINDLPNLGASIDQILREFPKATIDKLIELIKDQKIYFIGYAARDPDLHLFISEMVNKVSNLYWIDIGPCNKRINQLLGSKFEYYGQGAPRALEIIFNLFAQKPIKFEEPWEQKIDKTISNFEQSDLANIAADLCLLNNSSFSLDLIENIHTKLNILQRFNQFHIIRRKIQVLFHSPKINANNSINFLINELEKLSLNETDRDLKYNINLSIANTIWRLSNPIESIRIINNLIKDSNQNSTQYLDLLIQLGIAKIYFGCDYFKDGIKDLEHSKELATKLNFPIQAAEASLRLSIGLMRGSDPKRSEIELLKAKSIFVEIGNPKQLFQWQLNLAESYRNQRKYNEALPLLENLISQATLAEDTEIIINAKANKGLNFVSIGKYLEGDLAFSEIIATTQKLGINQETRANAFYNRGWLRVICYLWKEAIFFLQLAAKSYKNDFYSPERKGSTLSLIGVGYYLLGDKEKSKSILSKIRKEKIIPKGYQYSDFKLLQFLDSTTYFTKSQLEKAREMFNEEAEQLFFIFFMLLKKDPNNLEYFKNSVECAKKAKLSSFWGLLKLHANKNQLRLESSLIKIINDNAPEDLFFFQNKQTPLS